MLNTNKFSQQKTQIHDVRGCLTAHGKEAPKKVVFNLCKTSFRPRNRFELFCEQCRMTSETYRFAEWLVA